MHNQIVFADSTDAFTGYDVIESFDFGEAGVGAVIDVDSELTRDYIAHSSMSNYEQPEEVHLLWNLDAIDNDPDEQASLENTRSLHRAPGGHGDGGEHTVVVMDSGIDPDHVVFSGTTIAERHNMTDAGGNDAVGHGTACAGQIARLAPNAELIDLRIFGGRGSTGLEVIMRAYEWLVHNTDKYDIVNMSWGASRPIPEIDRIHQLLLDEGVRDVVSAGNSGGPSGSPATTPGAFSVGACTQYGNMADFSSYDPDLGNPDVTAIGKNNVLARASGTSMGRTINSDWTVASGTSFSSPTVAALIAKHWSVNPDLSADEVRDAFISTSENVRDEDVDGAGLVNYMASLSFDGGTGTERVAGTVWEFAGRDSLYVNSDILESGKYEVDPDKLRDAFEKVE